MAVCGWKPQGWASKEPGLRRGCQTADSVRQQAGSLQEAPLDTEEEAGDRDEFLQDGWHEFHPAGWGHQELLVLKKHQIFRALSRDYRPWEKDRDLDLSYKATADLLWRHLWAQQKGQQRIAKVGRIRGKDGKDEEAAKKPWGKVRFLANPKKDREMRMAALRRDLPLLQIKKARIGPEKVYIQEYE